MLYAVEESKVNLSNEKYTTDYIKWQHVINSLKTDAKESVNRAGKRETF